MVGGLALRGTERMLEVGTGYGWQTAALGAGRGVGAERRALGRPAVEARARLARAGAPSAEMVAGDTSEGLPEHAPLDAIVAAAAFPLYPRLRPLSSPKPAGWCSRWAPVAPGRSS
jgi:protein-L-isoaspartate(D-aspartate) O-methyltransferase